MSVGRSARSIARRAFQAAGIRIASRWLRIGPPAAEGGEVNPVGSSSTSGMSARPARSTPGRVSSVARSVSSAVRLPGPGCRRQAAAEERAHVLPVKLVLPLAFFVFPVMLIVTLMPVFIRIYAVMFE